MSNDVSPPDFDVAHIKMFVGISENPFSKVMVTSISEFALQSNAGVKTDPVCIFARPVKLLFFPHLIIRIMTGPDQFSPLMEFCHFLHKSITSTFKLWF